MLSPSTQDYISHKSPYLGRTGLTLGEGVITTWLQMWEHFNANLLSINVQEWKSTLLGVILGITSIWSENPLSNSEIHSQIVKSTLKIVNQTTTFEWWIPVFSTILSVDFHSKTK